MKLVSKRRLSFAFIAPLTLLTLTLVGCGGGGDDGPPIPAQPLGTIAGVVTGSGPIEGAKVSTDVGEYLTITDAQGAYSIDVAPGSYTLIVHASGRKTATVENIWVVDGATVSLNVEVGPPLEPGESTYVGSLRCKLCHNELYQTWKTSGHATFLKTGESAIVPGARDDFTDGLDLSTDSSFAACDPAPVLGLDPVTGVYNVTVGNITYPVDRAQGGGRGWQQRYQTKIGNSHYILPVQYNEVPGDWVPYLPENWYDPSGAPQYSDAATLVQDVDKPDSYDRRCAGCHHTGMEIELNPAGEYVASFAELNNGCESCHGPGSDHIVTQLPEDIVNPRNLTLALADQTCAKCHLRGSSTATLGGTTFGYPWSKIDDTPFEPGEFLAEHTVDAGGDWWDSLSTSAQHRQQSNDYRLSEHFGEYGVRCSDCHDPHGSPFGYERDVVVPADDNNLCYLCHGGRFPDDATVTAHTNHASATEPNCLDCHMPLVAKSAVSYDIRAHTFEPISPAESSKMIVAGAGPVIPNSCMNGSCHTDEDSSLTKWSLNDGDDVLAATAQYNAWYNKGGPPLANAGADQLAVGFDALVGLDGTLSTDPDGITAELSFVWTQSSGDKIDAMLDLTDPAAPTFITASIEETLVADGLPDPNNVFEVLPITYDTETAGAYNFTMQVGNGTDTSSDSVTVMSSSRVIGDNNIPVGTLVHLNGGDLTAYDWQIVSQPASSEAVLSNPTSRYPSFVPDAAGEYVISEATQGDLVLYAGTYVGTDRCSVCHAGQVPNWETTAHATIFSGGIDGTVSDHYAESCLPCHTVGHDEATEASNRAFDDVAAALGWEFPEHPGPGNWDAVPDELKSVSNIACESCHGVGSEHEGYVPGIGDAFRSESCGFCHGGTRHGQYPQWAQSGHARFDPTEHFFDSGSCVGCHDGRRFVAQQINGEDQAVSEDPQGQTCATCHDPHLDPFGERQLRAVGVVSLPNGFTVDAGNAKMCSMCHNSRRSDPEDRALNSTSGPHSANQSETFYGTGAIGTFEYPGAAFDEPSLADSWHAQTGALPDACVTCHMREGRHEFEPSIAACADCHAHSSDWDEWGGAGSFNRPADDDYDGTGEVEGIEDEFHGLLFRVLSALTVGAGSGIEAVPDDDPTNDLGFGNVWLGSHPYWELREGVTDDERRAMYNFVLFEHDPGAPLHNTSYAIRVLRETWAAIGKNMLDDPAWEPGGADYDSETPHADAGFDRLSAGFGNQVTLSASGSFDPDGDFITYDWTQDSGDPISVVLDLTDPAAPTFELAGIEDTFAAAGLPDPINKFGVLAVPYDLTSAGTYDFTVEVSDGTNTATDTVTVGSANRAVGGHNVPIGTLVYLNGGVLLAYDWEMVSKPSGSNATLADPTTRHPSFMPDVVGEYVISEATQGSMTLFGSTYAGTTACQECHEDKVDDWETTNHATIFSGGIDGTVSDHYAENCVSCHSVGYDLAAFAVNGGFDDVADDVGWVFPEHPGPGNWDAVPDQLKAVSNIACESCHGPGSQGAESPLSIGTAFNSESCGTCHGGTRHGQYPQWTQSRHAHFDPTEHFLDSSSCVGCHDGSRFVAQQINGEDRAVSEDPQPQTCATCHDPHIDPFGERQLRAVGVVSLPNGFTVDAGNAKMCSMCHNSRRADPEDRALTSTSGPHSANQSETFYGTGAIGTFEYPGASFFEPSVADSDHPIELADACVTCHMHEGRHEFEPSIEACAVCHDEDADWASWGGVGSFNRPAEADYDGDGAVAGLEDEYHGLLDRVLAALTDGVGSGIEAVPDVDPSNDLGFGNEWLGSHPYWTLRTNVTDDERRAMYNFVLFEHDPAAALHNTAYAIEIMRRTWEALGKRLLDDSAWTAPGADY